MISPISFSSTYKVGNNDMEAFRKFQNYAFQKERQRGVSSFNARYYNSSNENLYYEEQTLVVPDKMDNRVEAFCRNHGIEYKKLNTQDLLNPKTITKRIEAPNKNYKKVEVDADKLEKLVKRQDSNIPHCKRDYDNYFYEDVDKMLRSGNEFPATTLFINPMTSNEDLKEYVDIFGVENLNYGQIMIDFCQLNVEPDHCVYFGLRDIGMNKIPVYVDEQSYEAGKILGLF